MLNPLASVDSCPLVAGLPAVELGLAASNDHDLFEAVVGLAAANDRDLF